jgi:ATP-dependent NAD(P)H-hydrate dehydratase
MILGCIAGSLLLRKAALLAFEKNKRSAVTTDIIEFLGQRYGVTCMPVSELDLSFYGGSLL